MWLSSRKSKYQLCTKNLNFPAHAVLTGAVAKILQVVIVHVIELPSSYNLQCNSQQKCTCNSTTCTIGGKPAKISAKHKFEWTKGIFLLRWTKGICLILHYYYYISLSYSLFNVLFIVQLILPAFKKKGHISLSVSRTFRAQNILQNFFRKN